MLSQTKVDTSTMKQEFKDFRGDIMNVIDNLNQKVYSSLEEQRNVFRNEYDDLRKRICKAEDNTMLQLLLNFSLIFCFIEIIFF